MFVFRSSRHAVRISCCCFSFDPSWTMSRTLTLFLRNTSMTISGFSCNSFSSEDCSCDGERPSSTHPIILMPLIRHSAVRIFFPLVTINVLFYMVFKEQVYSLRFFQISRIHGHKWTCHRFCQSITPFVLLVSCMSPDPVSVDFVSSQQR